MGTYEINLKISEENDLYHPMDEAKNTLNSDVIDYITEHFNEKNFRDKIVININTDTPMNEERVKKAFQNFIRSKTEKNKKQKRMNLLKQLRLLLIGIIFVTAAIIFNNRMNSVLVELISIVGSFSVWEAANIWIVENPKMRLEKRLLQFLSSTELVIHQQGA